MSVKSTWCVYKIHRDGCDEVKFTLNSVCDSLDQAKKQVSVGLGKKIRELKNNYDDEWEDLINPVHDSMNKKNSYTFVGPRTQCRRFCGSRYLSFGGWVIEKIQPNTLIK